MIAAGRRSSLPMSRVLSPSFAVGAGEGRRARMGYVIAGIIVLLIVAGFVTFLVMNTMRKSPRADTEDPSARQGGRGGTPGIGEDPTPLGDTTEHAGEQSPGGATESDPEAAERGVDPGGDKEAAAGGAPA